VETEQKSRYLQLNQSYIVTTVKSGLLVIDQHLAHSRILFEKFLKEMETNSGHSQQELFPQPFTLNINDASLMREMMPELQQVGFSLEQVNPTTFVINGTPADLSGGDPVSLLEKMLDNYKINRSDLQLDRKLGIAKTMSAQLSLKNNVPLSETEMQNIVDQLFGCNVAEIAPDGKKIYVLLTLDELIAKINS
jgi:DNA mismatch repair protein MutL